MQGGYAKMGRVYNFSAGPAVLPEEVLKEAADEMLDFNSIFLISALFCNFSFINFHELTTFTNFFEYFTWKRI